MSNYSIPKCVRAAIVSLAFMLTACGGGGGGGTAPPTGPVTSTLSFPVQSALATRTASGASENLTANGDGSVLANGLCSGTLSKTTGPANTATTFEGVSAFSATVVLQINFTNCVPASIAQTVTAYVDSTYAPLGNQVLGGQYFVRAAPFLIPNAVKVGNVGIVGTFNIFTDASKTTPDGRQDMSFVVEPDTADTAIINLIFKGYNSASQLLFTEQDRYRITSTGALTLISVDIQYSTTSTTHLVFR